MSSSAAVPPAASRTPASPAPSHAGSSGVAHVGSPAGQASFRLALKLSRAGHEHASTVSTRALAAMPSQLTMPKAPARGAPKEGDAAGLTASRGATEPDPRARERREIDAMLDPLERHTAQLAPPCFAFGHGTVVAPTAGAEAPSAALRSASLETLLPALVRKIAWSAESKERGTVRLEIGAGDLQGAVLVVHADAGEVKIHVSVPNGADKEAWRSKLARRLEARGVRVSSLDVE